ncbi:MAG: T9SS C-terminal target domain-containing protein [Sphingobacteriia bacterium]|nr:T9SS C-terminal target domain-containing protein [Sphingobacteriia bacterium]
MTGRTVYNTNYIRGEEIQIDLKNQCSGIYMLTLTGNGAEYTEKLSLVK